MLLYINTTTDYYYYYYYFIFFREKKLPGRPVSYGAPFAVFETLFCKSQKLICTQLCLVNLFQEVFNCTLISRSFQMQFSIASNNAF
jgi:hypothetical protein